MRIPVLKRPFGIAALMIAGLTLSGCVTDGYGRSYGSVSVGTGWYDGYYPGYYPGYYYGYDDGYWGYPGGYYYTPRAHSHRWRDRDRAGKPDSKWQGRRDSRDRHQAGRDRRSNPGHWQGRTGRSPSSRAQPVVPRPQMNGVRQGSRSGGGPEGFSRRDRR